MNNILETIQESQEEYINAPCCKVCQCSNGKKTHCACHRTQFKTSQLNLLTALKEMVEGKHKSLTASEIEALGRRVEMPEYEEGYNQALSDISQEIQDVIISIKR